MQHYYTIEGSWVNINVNENLSCMCLSLIGCPEISSGFLTKNHKKLWRYFKVGKILIATPMWCVWCTLLHISWYRRFYNIPNISAVLRFPIAQTMCMIDIRWWNVWTWFGCCHTKVNIVPKSLYYEKYIIKIQNQ